MYRYWIYIVMILGVSACNYSFDADVITYEPKVVVEGSIENGEYPSVLLSVSAPVTGTKDTISLLSYAIRSALVTVSDGEYTDTLILKRNNEKLPPFEYKGRKFKGEAGKHYELQVKYDGKIITGSTYIPEPVKPDSIWFIKNEKVDSIGYLGIRFKNSTQGFYQVATAPYTKTLYTPCLYGNIDGRKYSREETIEMQLNKGPVIFPEPNLQTYFNRNDTIKIKFSVIPEVSYHFWCDYQNETINATNPIFPAASGLTGNISGGIGLWSGYGSTVYQMNFTEIVK